MKPKTNLIFDPRTLSEAENESRFRSSNTMRSRKRISISIIVYYAKPKMNFDFHLQVLSEAENEFRFRLPTLYEAQNES